MTTVLSIQSHVAFGHVGNAAATFPLMRMGVEVLPIHTVMFSNHTGYGEWRGPHIAPDQVAEVVRGIDERGRLGDCDAVLTGYQGAEAMGAVILDTVDLVKRRNAAALYCCDPVLGDAAEGFYVLPGIPEFMRDQVVPRADIVTPNHFELEFLTGREARTVEDVLQAAMLLRERGPATVLVTSAVLDDVHDALAMIAVGDQGAFVVTTPLLHRSFTGSGDLTSATFLTHLLQTGDLATALARTASIVYSVLEFTAAARAEELALVGAQDDLVTPRHTFASVPLG